MRRIRLARSGYALTQHHAAAQLCGGRAAQRRTCSAAQHGGAHAGELLGDLVGAGRRAPQHDTRTRTRAHSEATSPPSRHHAPDAPVGGEAAAPAVEAFVRKHEMLLSGASAAAEAAQHTPRGKCARANYKKRRKRRMQAAGGNADEGGPGAGAELPPPRHHIRPGAETMAKTQGSTALIGLGDEAVAAYLKRNYSRKDTNNSANRAMWLAWLRRDLRDIDMNSCEVGDEAMAAVISLLMDLRNPWEAADRFAGYLERRRAAGTLKLVGVRVWSAGVHALAKAGRVRELDAILAELPPVPARDVAHIGNALLLAYRKAAPDKAKAAYRMLKAHGHANEASLVLYLSLCSPTEADDELRERTTITPRTFAATISTCSRHEGVGRAAQLWQDYEPRVKGGTTVHAWNAMLQVCRTFDDHAALEYWMQRMAEKNVAWDAYTYSTTIMALAEASMHDNDRPAQTARTMFAHACTSGDAQNVKVCGAIAQLHAKHKDADGMKALLDYMHTNAVYVTSVMKAYIDECGR